MFSTKRSHFAIAITAITSLAGCSSEEPGGITYDGVEYERLRSTYDEVDRATLALRRTQPIHFLGLPMRQIPTDNWLMGELIHQIKPDYVIETGTLFGGSAVYYSGMLEFVNPEGRVITIDINEEQLHREARSHPLWKRRVQFIRGGSTTPEVIRQVRDEVGNGKRVLVTLDTLHAPDHVSQELALYSQFVSPGSYLILQDTFYDGLPQVLDSFLASHEAFVRDSELDDRFGLTKHRGGFLRRR